ncbi:MAG: lipopolysaccharide transport periplasmic protein LptA [Gammaproteobacteria bacterium]|nr:lipopolysaccharide transport periplasmic protein LptA [Gammaproteobacteria bacterium]
MAAFLPDAARLAAAAAFLCCCAAVAAPTPRLDLPRPSKDQPIDLVAASSDVDYKNNTLLFRQVKITQGPLKVEAQEATATGLDFDNSDWTLTGQVRITMPDGKLASSDAKVTFRNNEIAQATVHGTPAEFEQKLKDTQQLARGHANTIEYNVQAGTVKLTGAAWLTDGDNVIEGDTLVYDVAKQRVAANPGGTDPGGVRITINPKSQDKPGSKDKPKSPAPDETAPPKGQPSQ